MYLPETSIVVTLNDRYSETAKKLSQVTKAFSKDAEGLEQRLYTLNKNKYTLKLDAQKAKQELKEAEKQFSATGKEADGLKMELAQANYDNIVRNLKAVTTAAGDTEKAISKTMNRAGSSKGAVGIVDAIAQTGIANMASNVALNASNAIFSSVLGEAGGNVFSSGLSMAITGAAMGAIIPGIGTAAGAVLGGIAGMASGGIQNWERKDDAFKSYVQDAYEGQMSAQETSLTSGSALAAQRETDRISFETLFRRGGVEDMGIVETYLSNLVEMANNTPFLYGDLTAMSKTLATYGYSAQADQEKALSGEKDYNYILDVLETIGDAGAALGQSTGDMETVATAIGRMKSSNKATLEYLNILNDRGIGAVGYLAEAKGVSVGDMYKMISKSEIGGGEAVDILLAAMERDFSGSMGRQAETFEGLTSTLTGILQEADNAMGEGYNSERGKSLISQIESYGGELGEALAEANKAIGTGRAALDNLSDQYTEEALAAVLTGRETALDWSDQNAGRLKELGGLYQEAMADYRSGNAQAGTLVETYLEEARALAAAEYQSGSAIQDQTEAENAMIEALRENTSALNGWQNNYNTQQNLSKGRLGISKDVDIGGTVAVAIASGKGLGRGYAYGLDYVPYDNFPALLHQGERVQTAAEARSGGGSTAVYISGNTFAIREAADVDAVAEALLEKIQLAGVRG